MIIVCSFSLSYFGISQVNAAFNKQMNYQGKLTTPLGIAVADGDYNMEFVLYNHPTSGGANILRTETRTGGDKVSLTNGLFSVMLGEVTSLTGVDFDQSKDNCEMGLEVHPRRFDWAFQVCSSRDR